MISALIDELCRKGSLSAGSAGAAGLVNAERTRPDLPTNGEKMYFYSRWTKDYGRDNSGEVRP